MLITYFKLIMLQINVDGVVFLRHQKWDAAYKAISRANCGYMVHFYNEVCYMKSKTSREQNIAICFCKTTNDNELIFNIGTRSIDVPSKSVTVAHGILTFAASVSSSFECGYLSKLISFVWYMKYCIISYKKTYII